METPAELKWTENYGVMKCYLFKGLICVVVAWQSEKELRRKNDNHSGGSGYTVTISGSGAVRLKAIFKDVNEAQAAGLEWVRRNIAEPKP